MEQINLQDSGWILVRPAVRDSTPHVILNKRHFLLDTNFIDDYNLNNLPYMRFFFKRDENVILLRFDFNKEKLADYLTLTPTHKGRGRVCSISGLSNKLNIKGFLKKTYYPKKIGENSFVIEINKEDYESKCNDLQNNDV
jgi:hypothetical protein